MASTQSTVLAVFRSSDEAQAVVNDLVSHGIPRQDIHVEANADDDLGTRLTPHEGGAGGWFQSLFRDNDTAERGPYEAAVQQGHVLLRVDAPETQLDTVGDVLDRHSPIDVHQDAARSAEGAPPTGTSTPRTTTVGDAGQTIPVVEEEIQVGTRRILRGGVRVYARIVEEPVQETVRLREEHVRVERVPADRPAGPGDLEAGQDKVIEVQEYAEEPVVTKQARVVEEVRVAKESAQRTETVRDSVRHTEVDVEQIPGGATAGAGSSDDADFRRDFDTRYGASGAGYDTYAPAYRYGSEMAGNPQYRGKSFAEAENDLRSDYGRRYPNSTWDKMKDSVRYGWDRVTGRTKGQPQ
ncbi:MAG: hypothetical protein JWP08_3937 [Bryobacterales bacterium]|jgi:stress response protein YsnF|nr:hypothetical protein [Bryobacterales bacterium]